MERMTYRPPFQRKNLLYESENFDKNTVLNYEHMHVTDLSVTNSGCWYSNNKKMPEPERLELVWHRHHIFTISQMRQYSIGITTSDRTILVPLVAD